MKTYRTLSWHSVLLFGALTLLVGTPQANAADDEPAATQSLTLVQDQLKLTLPAEWERVEPRSQMITHEFSIPAPDEGDDPGRMTIMAAGGSIEANIDRWVGQFRTSTGQLLGENDKKVSVKEVGDTKVHLVDLRGDFFDQPRGPFGPKVQHSDYRLLGAIIPTAGHGTWFVKFYGPEETVTAAEQGFNKMVETIELR